MPSTTPGSISLRPHQPPAAPLYLTSADREEVSRLANDLLDSASDGFDPQAKSLNPATDAGRFIVAHALFGLVAESLSTASGVGGAEHGHHLAVASARVAKQRAMCLRNLGLRDQADAGLREVASRQAALRDPDQSGTWINISNLSLSRGDPEGAIAAGLAALEAAERDGWPSRMREALAGAGVGLNDPAAREVGHRLFEQIGALYATPSDRAMGEALRQLDDANEAAIDASFTEMPEQAAQRRLEVLTLSARALGATHEDTLLRAAVHAHNNAGLWLRAGRPDAALAESRAAVDFALRAGLEAGALEPFSRRLATCLEPRLR